MDFNKEETNKLMYEIWNPKEYEKWDALIRTMLEENGLGVTIKMGLFSAPYLFKQ